MRERLESLGTLSKENTFVILRGEMLCEEIASWKEFR